jgi:N6-L-threonylcarbamoyladenine synthase
MYGRALEAFAFPPESPLSEYDYNPPRRRGDDIAPHLSEGGWSLIPPMADNKRLEYNFSILLSHVMTLLSSRPDISESVHLRRILARDIMKLAFEHLIGRLLIAAEQDPSLKRASTLVISGGVAANKFLMRVVREMLAVRGFGQVLVTAPPVEFCTDNAAMIAWAGWEMWREGWTSGMRITALKRWSVDDGVEGGILGATEWVKREGIETTF